MHLQDFGQRLLAEPAGVPVLTQIGTEEQLKITFRHLATLGGPLLMSPQTYE